VGGHVHAELLEQVAPVEGGIGDQFRWEGQAEDAAVEHAVRPDRRVQAGQVRVVVDRVACEVVGQGLEDVPDPFDEAGRDVPRGAAHPVRDGTGGGGQA